MKLNEKILDSFATPFRNKQFLRCTNSILKSTSYNSNYSSTDIPKLKSFAQFRLYLNLLKMHNKN